jgi:transcriptional regulator with XRE-family HTH domain
MRRDRGMDRRDVVELFRERLLKVIADSGMTRSAFAAAVDIDRSTLSQILSPENDRLPRIETLAAIASARQVSLDWLLGLSQRGAVSADILREKTAIERNAGSPSDRRLIAWQTEAIGYKIRYVPVTLPDLLKTVEVIRYEMDRVPTVDAEQRIETAAAGLAYQRRPETDMEACSPIQGVEAFARGEGIWRDLSPALRWRQIAYMSSLLDELYPTFRWFLFDGRAHYSAPVTVFGPLRAALYIGGMYMVFNSTEHIRALSEHFDGLIRHAVVQPPDVPGYLRRLVADCALSASS